MIKRLLIANRGEIAVRIIRSCREMGIESVAVYSTADADSLHVALADKAVCIGPPPSAQSYLVKENLLMAALHTGCEAIHPGVGFLSENAEFARSVRREGLAFIGPESETIELLGDKIKAKKEALAHGLPVTPGTGAVGNVSAEETARRVREIGYPVIIKAASGGGGNGMRIVRSEQELAGNIEIASREALANFADGTVFIEKYLENPRHVELQILADGNGNVAVLGERDCTVQKNHQKLIEESPSPAVGNSMRDAMTKGATSLFRDLKYRGAGTIEFLMENGEFYFMEVNARVQVEHPVSEMITSTDIIREQILACTEGRMEINSADVRLSGAAMECRINALLPGKIKRLRIPGGPGVRFDSFVYQDYVIQPYYDSMIAKLIVHDTDRKRAIEKMKRALDELVIDGVRTNIESQRKIMDDKTFCSGNFGTSYYALFEKENAL